ncbi:MAG: hypothetical protein ACREDV_09695 [Methylocella sp.]
MSRRGRDGGGRRVARALARCRSQAIIARLTKLSPDNATWKGGPAWVDGRIAALTER